jgi:peptidoglycan/LPS O-acetylase OafA/YrhL
MSKINVPLSHHVRNAWCDCIRGYAILLVCVEHLMHVEPLEVQWGYLTRYFKGDTGVYMFYVLSGFLVTGILAREITSKTTLRSGIKAIGNFYARRLFRLWPSYLLFLILYAFLTAREASLPWWALLLPLSNWCAGPYITWHLKTLHIEEIYYLFFGLFAVLLKRSLNAVLWGLLVAGPAGRMTLFALTKMGNAEASWLLDHFLPLEAFAVGGLLVIHFESVRSMKLAKMITRWPAASFAAAMVVMLVTAGLRNVTPFSYVLLFIWPLVFSFASAVMIVSGFETKGFIFSSEWLRRLGVGSYTLYLFQQFALGPWEPTFGTPFSWPAWGLAVLLMATLLPIWFARVEKPLTELGARWFPRTALKNPVQS